MRDVPEPAGYRDGVPIFCSPDLSAARLLCLLSATPRLLPVPCIIACGYPDVETDFLITAEMAESACWTQFMHGLQLGMEMGMSVMAKRDDQWAEETIPA